MAVLISEYNYVSSNRLLDLEGALEMIQTRNVYPGSIDLNSMGPSGRERAKKIWKQEGVYVKACLLFFFFLFEQKRGLVVHKELRGLLHKNSIKKHQSSFFIIEFI